MPFAIPSMNSKTSKIYLIFDINELFKSYIVSLSVNYNNFLKFYNFVYDQRKKDKKKLS